MRPSDLANEQEYPVLSCTIEKPNAIKFDGSGGGTIILTFDESEIETVHELNRHYKMKELHVTFIKLPPSTT